MVTDNGSRKFLRNLRHLSHCAGRITTKQAITYKVILRRVHKNIFAAEKQGLDKYARVCVWMPGCLGVYMCARAYGYAYSTCNASKAYFIVICGLWLLHICRHYLTNDIIFEKKSY